MGNKFRKFTISGTSNADKENKAKEVADTTSEPQKYDKTEDQQDNIQNNSIQESENKTDTGQRMLNTNSDEVQVQPDGEGQKPEENDQVKIQVNEHVESESESKGELEVVSSDKENVQVGNEEVSCSILDNIPEIYMRIL
jgi:hypothetical protein